MPNGPVFMRATPAMFSARAQAASVVTAGQPAARMTTTVSEARMATVAQPMALANPRLVLPPQFYRRAARELAANCRQPGGEALLKSSMSSGFWPRCRGRAESLR